MHTLTVTTPSRPAAHQPRPARWRYRPGDLVLLAAAQPSICVVLAEPVRGLIRLSQAACPEIRLVAAVTEVQPLAGWLLSAC